MDIIDTSKQFLESNPTGHLSLPFRVMIMKEIKDCNVLNKIFFECAKKVFPVWEEDYEGVTPVYEMLQKADEFLYLNSGKSKDFVKLADKYKNYIEAIDGNAGAAGLAALYLCYSIATEASFYKDYNGTDDDNAFDYEDLLPDFYASMAWSGGNPFTNTGDVEKRREFWNWYLSIIEALRKSSLQPIISFKKITSKTESDKQFTRIQTVKTESIETTMQSIINRAVNIMQGKNIDWDMFKIEADCMKGGLSYKLISTKNDKQVNVDTPFPDYEYSIAQALSNIKKEMYMQNQREGAWFNCTVFFEKNRNYKFFLNYDDKNKIPQDKLNPEYLVSEFKSFPRAKEYTPEWWQKVLGKNAKYLE